MTDIHGIAPSNALSGRENLVTFSALINFRLALNFASNAKHSLPLNPSSPPDNLLADLYCPPGRNGMENDLEPIRLLTPRETAEALKVSGKTLMRLIRRNKLLGFRIGGQWRIRESELAQFIHNIEER
jgi:excisionase family DNA binding protein